MAESPALNSPITPQHISYLSYYVVLLVVFLETFGIA